jgi:hypothetical protein
VILACIPQQIKDKEARLTTSEQKIVELRPTSFVQANDLTIENGILYERQSGCDCAC